MVDKTCFLLSYLKYGDHDAILHCFTEDAGFQSFFCRGIYSEKSKKKPYLFPLNLIRISVSEKRTASSFLSIKKIERVSGALHFQDIKIYSILFFAADFLNQILREEGVNQKIFNELQVFCGEIFYGNIDAFLALIFKFLVFSGIAPLSGHGLFLDPISGTFRDQISHHEFDFEVSQIWKRYLNEEGIYEIRLRRSERKVFLDTLMIYYKHHYPSFYIPNSLAVLRAVFD